MEGLRDGLTVLEVREEGALVIEEGNSVAERDGLRVKEGRSDGLREGSFDLLFDFDEPGDGR
jgi:hypothetical protein